MNQKKKLSRKVISYVLALLMVFSTLTGIAPGTKLTAHAAQNTITWSMADIDGTGTSFTKYGITVTAGEINFAKKNFLNGGTFTTASGKFTKIEVTSSSSTISGTGWSKSDGKDIWTGDASSSVSFSGDIYGNSTTLSISFTIEGSYVDLIPIKDDDDTALSKKKVTFNGHKWYIIEDNSISFTEGTVTLFLAEASFGASKFSSNNNNNNYDDSIVKNDLINIVKGTAGNNKPNFSNVADAIIDKKMYLLGQDEVNNLPISVRKFDKSWWLCTPGDEETAADAKLEMIVYSSGNLHTHGYKVNTDNQVRPALKLDLSKVEYCADDTIRRFGFNVTGVTLNRVKIHRQKSHWKRMQPQP